MTLGSVALEAVKRIKWYDFNLKGFSEVPGTLAGSETFKR